MAKAPKKTAAASPAAAPAKEAQARTITIKGKGTVPLLADGAMRRVSRGVPIEISEAELAYIESNGIAIE